MIIVYVLLTLCAMCVCMYITYEVVYMHGTHVDDHVCEDEPIEVGTYHTYHVSGIDGGTHGTGGGI